jgi:hypothetical protein
MANVLKDEKKQQVIALGRLGWSLRRIQQATGVRRETASNYLKAAGISVRPAGAWGRRSTLPASVTVTPDMGVAPPAEPGMAADPSLSKPAGEGASDPAASKPANEVTTEDLGLLICECIAMDVSKPAFTLLANKANKR